MSPPVLVVLLLLSPALGQNPAVQVVLTDKGLQYGKNVVTKWIQEHLSRFTLPDISGDVHLGALGSVHYTLTGVTITKCDLPEPSTEFYQDATGFKTSVLGLSIALAGRWRTHFGIIDDGGSFDMAIFNVGVTSVVELGRDPDGHPSLDSVSCSAQVGGADMWFHGGASWIFKSLVHKYKGRIRGVIQDNICPKVEEAIVRLEGHLQAMNVSFDVNQDVTLDLPLTGLPVIDASSLNLGLKGEFYSIKTHREPPFEAQPFSMPEQLGYMLSVGLSEFTLNSATYGYFSAELLQAVINDSMIPPYSPVHLNTSSMGQFIPQLPKMFPDLAMNLLVYAREVPMFSLQPGTVLLDCQSAAKAFAIQPNGTQTPLFQLDVDSHFSGKVSISDGKLKGSVKMDNLTLTLASSEVGTFQTGAMEKFARLGAATVLAKVNEQLNKGVDLPRMKHAQLVDTVLEVKEGFIAVSSDAEVLLPDIFN